MYTTSLPAIISVLKQERPETKAAKQCMEQSWEKIWGEAEGKMDASLGWMASVWWTCLLTFRLFTEFGDNGHFFFGEVYEKLKGLLVLLSSHLSICTS